MRISIGGYSFHRLMESGKQDIFKYITDCKALGATQLDPWNEQLAQVFKNDEAARAITDPAQPLLSAEEEAFLDQLKAAAAAEGMPFGCLAVDGAHMLEPTPEARAGNRRIAKRWMEAAARLGCEQVRMDTGGDTEEMSEEAFEIIVAGYKELVALAREKGVELIMENHWGANKHPDNVVRILEAVPGLGLLFDSNNWSEGTQRDGWERCAKYARSTHFKTFNFDENGLEPSVDLPHCISLLKKAGYNGCWGVESVPEDGDEIGAVEKTIALIRKYAG